VTRSTRAGSAPSGRSIAWTPSEHELERRKARTAQERRRITVAAVSSILVIGGLVAIVLTSSGWPVVQDTFFNVEYGRSVVPIIWEAFKLDLKLSAIAVVFIAIISLGIALTRTSRSPALAPFRILAAVYVDLFRGIPLLLVLYLIGFGVPALGLAGVSGLDVEVLGTTAIVVTYSAYVAEVIRSGILSVHPSQRAAARSLGLSPTQTMRHVVLPQGLRRVVPPLLNDGVSLLKDVGLVSVLGVVEGIRQAEILKAKSFNFTPFVVVAIMFLIVTIPLTRITDRSLARALARQNSQGNA
jgi:polar amino acid transport system permease protein